MLHIHAASHGFNAIVLCSPDTDVAAVGTCLARQITAKVIWTGTKHRFRFPTFAQFMKFSKVSRVRKFVVLHYALAIVILCIAGFLEHSALLSEALRDARTQQRAI